MNLLRLPLWKWASIVEHWAWMNCGEGKESELQAMLDMPLNFTWIDVVSDDAGAALRVPASWQTNQPGESLLSRHRGKAAE